MTACPVCDDRVEDGELCPAHRALACQDPPVPLVKVTPPKQRDYISVASLTGGLDEPEPENRWWENGHATPDWLWTVLLVLFIFGMLVQLGVLGW